jgi:pimeloyl-ACP methyl ester carboxylesterase
MDYSLGGAAAFQVAIRHPELVRKLTVVSQPGKRAAYYPQDLAAMEQIGPGLAEVVKPSPLYQVYARTAPRLDDWPVPLGKLGALMREDFDWSRDIALIKAPTLLVFAGADAVLPEHIVALCRLLGGANQDGRPDESDVSRARLAILPGLTHYTIFSSPLLASAVASFLDVHDAENRVRPRLTSPADRQAAP